MEVNYINIDQLWSPRNPIMQLKCTMGLLVLVLRMVRDCRWGLKERMLIWLLTFTVSVDIAAEVVGTLLSINKLAEAVDEATFFFNTVIGLVGEIDLDAALNAFWDAVLHETLWKEKIVEIIKRC